MRRLTRSDVTFTVECEPEHIPIEGNASAIGPEEDAETYAWIRNQLDRGNEWAWCSVKVTAHWEGYHGVDYLGGCSYLSEKDFCQPGGYFDGMKDQALDDLNTKLAAMDKKLKVLQEQGPRDGRGE